MIHEVIRVFGIFALGYYLVMHVYVLVMALCSAYALRRNHNLQRFGRVSEMLSSRVAPPVSIVIPAYNEEAGIVDSIRSMSIVSYPRLEIVVVNDGSTDDTLRNLIEAFGLELVRIPYRASIPTTEIRGIYRGKGAVPITVVDKTNGSRADALNAGVNAARHPYVLCTDADVILDADCLVRSMQRVVEDRERTVGVGGHVRPINGSKVELGHLIESHVPHSYIGRMQILEYLRNFVAARPAWAGINALPNVSGAFGVWRRTTLLEVGGFARGHLGEDMDLTLRVHKFYRENGLEYRIAYEPSAVIWTEVPATRRVLRRQRIRWHRGLVHTVKDYWRLALNPRYGTFGMITWPGYVLFEFLAPVIEAIGYLVVPLGLLLGVLSLQAIALVVAVAYGVGLLNTFIAILLDEPYGYSNGGSDTVRLISAAMVENLGFHQMTVVWRIRALVGGRAGRVWGNMERRGVARLGDT